MQTYYGGPNAPIFDATLEPFRSIKAADLHKTWMKAAAARFAHDAKGDVTMYYNRVGTDLYDRAMRLDDSCAVYFENVVSAIFRADT